MSGKRIIFALGVTLSLLLFVATAALWVRSFRVSDSVSRSNWTERPLSDEAREYAKLKGFDAKFIGHGEGLSLNSYRGRIVFCRGLQLNVTSRWDEDFETKYVNKPNWSRTMTAIDDMSAPGGELSGLLGWLGFGDTEMQYTGGWQSSYRYVSVPMWFVATMSLIVPFVGVRRALRAKHRRTNGLCPNCGYDLRGGGERCPECGNAGASAGVAT